VYLNKMNRVLQYSLLTSSVMTYDTLYNRRMRQNSSLFACSFRSESTSWKEVGVFVGIKESITCLSVVFTRLPSSNSLQYTPR